MRERDKLFNLIMAGKKFMPFSEHRLNVFMRVQLVSQVYEPPSTPINFVEVCLDLPQIGAMKREILWICLAVGVTQSSCDCEIGKELGVIPQRAKASR